MHSNARLFTLYMGHQLTKKAHRAYTIGEAPDKFAQPRVGSRPSLLVLFLLQAPYIVLAKRIFAIRICSKITLRKHAYSNILKILPPKNAKFQIKNSDIFHVSAQNIDNLCFEQK